MKIKVKAHSLDLLIEVIEDAIDEKNCRLRRICDPYSGHNGYAEDFLREEISALSEILYDIQEAKENS